MSRPKGNGMCPVCKIKPHSAGHGYCRDCHSRYQSERYHSGRGEARNIGSWRSSGAKAPPTDWREVLRKADEESERRPRGES